MQHTSVTHTLKALVQKELGERTIKNGSLNVQNNK